MDVIEVPYGIKRLPTLVGFVCLAAVEAVIVFVAITAPPPTRELHVVIWVIAAVAAIPMLMFGIGLLFALFVRHTFTLTATDISAPRLGMSLHATRVPLSAVRRVTVGANGTTPSFRARHRFLNIHHPQGVLRIFENFMPDSKVFDQVLARFSRFTGADAPGP